MLRKSLPYLALSMTLVTVPTLAQTTVTPAMQRMVVESCGKKLRDPASARFTYTGLKLTGQLVYVCGYVNARNGLGGYAGNQPFSVLMDNVKYIMADCQIAEADAGPAELALHASQCR